MISNNYERMIRLVDEVFATSSDPNQIRVLTSTHFKRHFYNNHTMRYL
jgi:fibrillarin-like rRNA methylase